MIDYYSVPGESESTFKVDVRPALDSPSAFWDRFRDWQRSSS